MKIGTLKKTEEGWVIYHKLIDPYGQIPNPIPIEHKGDDLFDGKEVEFSVDFKYYAKIENIISSQPDVKYFKKCPYFCFTSCTCPEGVCKSEIVFDKLKK